MQERPEMLVDTDRQRDVTQMAKELKHDVAELTPLKPRVKRSVRGKPVTADDPLWKLVGIGHSVKGDISENKHKYLVEAYLPHKKV
jgi:hypothetical protein